VWHFARERAGFKPLTKLECQTQLTRLKANINKNLNNDEIMMNVDKRVEAKVLKGDITGIDVPYQMSRIRSLLDDLRSQLAHAKSESDRRKLQDQIRQKNEILKKLAELNKNRLKSLGAYTENGTTSSDDEDKGQDNQM
jgi:hypothetical protein